MCVEVRRGFSGREELERIKLCKSLDAGLKNLESDLCARGTKKILEKEREQISVLGT